MNDLSDNFPLDQVAPSESQYLRKEDLTEAGRVVTIASVKSAELENRDGKTENCHVLHFQESHTKPLVLKQTNRDLLKHYTGASTVGELKGKRITVYHDPTVRFGGKMMGGVRIKAAPQAEAPKAPNDDIPF